MLNKVFILSGPSGSGKTTLFQKLLLDHRFKNKIDRTLSVTTRPRREGEVCGLDYEFVSIKDFENKIAEDAFLEYEKVFDNYYGTTKKEVEKILNQGKNPLLCIDVKGAKTVLENFPEAVTIFIKTPSMDVLKERLCSRASDNVDAVKLRLETAKQELLQAENYKYILINDDLEQCFQQLVKIVETEILN